MYFQQFYLTCLSHASYLLGSAGVACVVDPQRDVSIYLEEAQAQGLKIEHIIETHLHADFVSVHVVQLRRYEAGSSQPTLDVIRRLAAALQVSADLLLFGDNQRGPDDDLKLQFEAVSLFDPEEKRVVRSLLDGMILKHEARRWSASEKE